MGKDLKDKIYRGKYGNKGRSEGEDKTAYKRFF